MAIHRSGESGICHAAAYLHGKSPLPALVILCILIYFVQYSSGLASGVNSPLLSIIIVGVVSQVWLRQYHPGWYKRYNYVLGGALDGGSQVMIFILTFAVFGASGNSKAFPAWAGNPGAGNIDYCNGNGALSG